ncbi:MAG: chemotaxis-specific protein-glutamate methyltransferase CheB [Lachnospiraceae bacterium]|nr:chemotaxis-specific protein-glutamate methyltransferase CheB [Lachnospiraceae bacterium]
MTEKKKILVVDDSALMRSVLCDIINSDGRFQVVDRAINGVEAFDLLTRKQYDAVVLDVNMPKMTGIELLKELQKRKIPARIMMASTDTMEGAKVTMDCLELGAIDFIHKPSKAMEARDNTFKEEFIKTLEAVSMSKLPTFEKAFSMDDIKTTRKMIDIVKKHDKNIVSNQVVAIACSTGGPKALQQVIPRLPKDLKAPVLIVQHMPAGFTKSLADRLNTLSELTVKEAEEGDVLTPGTVYLAKGGMHMKVITKNSVSQIHFSDEPAREGVKPCANYMYESLVDSPFEQVLCVVMTGMGADGTKGIVNLETKKKVHVIVQEESTCAVYGMPKSVANAGLADQIVGLEQLSQEIIMNVGVR